MNLVGKYTESLLRMVYPLLCKTCGDEVYCPENLLCWRCLEQLPYTTYEKHPENPVKHIFAGRLHLQNAYSLLFFSADSVTQALVHRIKYNAQKPLGIFAGEMMGKSIQESYLKDAFDIIVPLPLNEKKLAQRGYNQSALLANGIANVLQIPVSTTAVIRTRYTTSQTRKGRMQRWLNVEHVFAVANPAELENKHILLVDDVITTGATMEAMGRELLKIPGLRLSIASLAFTSRI